MGIPPFLDPRLPQAVKRQPHQRCAGERASAKNLCGSEIPCSPFVAQVTSTTKILKQHIMYIHISYIYTYIYIDLLFFWFLAEGRFEYI